MESILAQPCDLSTPTYTVDLTGAPDSIWQSPVEIRDGFCCSASGSDRCIEFIVTLDPGALGIQFNIAAGAVPPGALFYEIDCTNPTQVGDTLCLDGAGPHRITFCKPGNNSNIYEIVSVEAPGVSDAITVSDGCSGIIYVNGYDESTVNWAPVPFNADYVDYMSCTSGCDTVNISVTQPGYPAFIDFEVSGYPPASLCDTSIVRDTVRVYFVSDKFVEILPENPVVCFGGSNTTITANPSGGAPPYTYLWNTGETTQSISVGAGTYWVEVFDTTNCPTVLDTVVVTANLSPISADAGLDAVSCTNLPTATIAGTVNVAGGGIWSGGSGSYSPSDTALTTNYTPTPAEINAGSVTLTLTTTDNDGCPPETDNMTIIIEPAPTIDAGSNQIVCGDINSIPLSGTFTNAGGVVWSSSGTGTFGNLNNPITNYVPSTSDTAAGTITLTLTTTLTGACAPVSDIVNITFTPIPVVNANLDQRVCSDVASVSLGGLVTVATGGTWTTNGTGTFSPNANTLTANYIPSALDAISGDITLTLTSTGNGNCNAYSDQMIITFYNAPTVNVGPDQTVCADIGTVNLSPTTTDAVTYLWTTTGSGLFTPNNTTEIADYIPSNADTANGSITLTLTVLADGCSNYEDDLNISITPSPTVNAGNDITTCKDISSVSLSGVVTVGTGGTWSTSGTGSFSPSANSLGGNYIPSSADTAAGSVTLTLTTTGNGTCNSYTDDVLITFTEIPTVNAGLDQSICADIGNVPLSGAITIATGGIWTTSGTGTFTPGNTSLGGVYHPSNADTTAGSVTLTLTTNGNGLCNAYNDQMIITISPAPVVLAGSDQIVCGDIAIVGLNGSVINASGGFWSTSGTGTFSPNNTALNANYIPSAADTLAGSITLTLTSTGNGTCNTYADQMTISFTPAPTVDAGIDITTCKDIASIDLSGAIVTATGGTWSTSGTGTFNPNNTTLTAAYIPSAADTAAGSITLTLTTTGNGLCNAYSDQMTITLTDIPTVDAGADQIICADAASAFLGGSVNNATGGIWSTSGTGTFNPNNTTLTAAYIPSEADTVAGSVTLTLTTTGNGLCNAYSDQITITITPAPIANAGPDQTLCADITAIPLSGEITTATGGVWSTSGTGTFSPNANTLNASYIPTTADTIAGSVILTLTTAGNGTCNTYADQVTISFTPAPTVDAGIDITTCKDIASIDLSGAIVTATGGTWSTSGTGTFNPNNTTLTAAYIPSAADTAAGSITLTLTTTGNGLCNAYSDQMTITLTDIPVAYASSDQIVCADISGISLNGGIAIAAGGIWTTNGTGIFSPSETALNATYIPSAGDTAIGSATLTLTTTGNGLCQSYTDQMMITITPAPISFAGNDTSVCSTNPVVPLIGSVVTATGGIWSTNGSGTFTPNNTDLNAIYQTSLSDQTNGSVEIYLTTTGNGLCNSVTDTMLLTITPTSITVFVGNDTLVCGDDSLILNAAIQTAAGGIWTTLGDGTFSDSSDLNASYYFGANDTIANTVELYFTTTGNGGCLAQVDSLQVDIQNPLELSVMSNDTACRNGGAFNIFSTTNTGQGYWITNGDGSFSPDSNSLNPQYLMGNTDTTSNNITLTFITENNGVCTAISDSIIIDLIDAPAVNFGFADICLNETVFFTDSSSAIGGVTDWSWDFNDTILSSQQDTNVTFTSFGTQTATLVVTSGYGCIDSLTQNIIVSPLPTAALTSNADCYEDSVEMFDASTVATGTIVEWEWMIENGFTGNTQNVSVIFDSASVYSTTLIVTTDMGCTDTITDSLQVQPNPIASFISDSVCLNELSNMVDASTVEFGTIVTWEWIIDGLSTDTLSATTYTFDSDSLQPVTLIVTSSFGCIDTVTQDIMVHPLPNSAFSYEGFCEEDNVLFTDESTINTGQVIAWNWDFGNTESSVEQNPSNGFGVAGTFDVTLITTSNYGCADTTAQNISISPNPTAEFSMSSNIAQVLDPIYFTDESIDASQWEWDFGDTIGTSTDQNPDYAWNTYNQYTVSLIITNDFGCTDTVTHIVTVKQPPKLPLAFSPNGDGLNDIFYVIGGTFVEFRFEIYNNWGKMIFESNDPLIGWDGTHQDIEQPLGVYVWIYHVVTEDGEEYSEHGDVTIIR